MTGKYTLNGQNYAFKGLYQIVHDMFAIRRGSTPNRNASGASVRKINSESNISRNGTKLSDAFAGSTATLNSKHPFFRAYDSRMRRIGLRLCGKEFVTSAESQGEQDVTDHIEYEIKRFSWVLLNSRLERQGMYEEAAAVSLIYNADIARAVKSFNSSGGMQFPNRCWQLKT